MLDVIYNPQNHRECKMHSSDSFVYAFSAKDKAAWCNLSHRLIAQGWVQITKTYISPNSGVHIANWEKKRG